eukprot:2161706-Pleurochrysis_carterae.AAC.2
MLASAALRATVSAHHPSSCFGPRGRFRNCRFGSAFARAAVVPLPSTMHNLDYSRRRMQSSRACAVLKARKWPCRSRRLPLDPAEERDAEADVDRHHRTL